MEDCEQDLPYGQEVGEVRTNGGWREPCADRQEPFVVVVDAFGNGVSSSPSNSTAQSGSAFPRITLRDMLRHQHRFLTEHLGVSRLNAVVGISMGGVQAFEWAVSYPGFSEKIVPVVGSRRLAVYDIVLWETDLRILEWFLDCRCQPPAALRQGLYFLMEDRTTNRVPLAGIAC